MNKAVHHITVIYLASIILLRMMAMPISLIDYSLNKQFIARHLCENRFRANVTCSGKCFLTKQLAKSGDGQAGTDQKGGVKISLIDFFEPLKQLRFGFLVTQDLPVAAFRILPLVSRSLDDIFHPPIA